MLVEWFELQTNELTIAVAHEGGIVRQELMQASS